MAKRKSSRVPEPKKPTGRPTLYRDDFHPEEYLRMCRDDGSTKAQIAASFGVARDRISEWSKKHPRFADAIKAGAELREAWWVSWGKSMVHTSGENEKVNATLFVWLTKTCLGWRETIHHEITDDGALTFTDPKDAPDAG